MNSSGFSSASTSSYMDSSFEQMNDGDSFKHEMDLTPTSVLSLSNPPSATSSVHNTDDEEDDTPDRILSFK